MHSLSMAFRMWKERDSGWDYGLAWLFVCVDAGREVGSDGRVAWFFGYLYRWLEGLFSLSFGGWKMAHLGTMLGLHG